MTSAEDDGEDTAEIKVFSAKVVLVENVNGTVSAVVTNVQKWEKEVPVAALNGTGKAPSKPTSTGGDQTVMYFLDDKGDVELSNVTEVKFQGGATLPCNNTKHQFYVESGKIALSQATFLSLFQIAAMASTNVTKMAKMSATVPPNAAAFVTATKSI